MDQKWTKYEYVCSYCDSAITFVTTITQDTMLCPVCFNGYATLLSVDDATIIETEEKEVPPMNATTTFLETQVAALQEHIEKKDEYIIRLQDEVSKLSQTVYTVRAEQQNFRNSVKEYVIESLQAREMMHGNAEALAEICDFELTKTVTVTATVDFEVELEVPFDMDADDVANGLEFSVDSFDYSIDDFSLDVTSLQASDNIS